MNRLFLALACVAIQSCMTPDDVPQARHLPGTTGACVEGCADVKNGVDAEGHRVSWHDRCVRKCRTGCPNITGCK
jgi:hypothetical protein